MSSHQELLNNDFPALQLVRTGRTVRLLGRLTLYALIATIILMVFVPWRQTARGTGTVVALDPQQRPQPVYSPAEGQIKSVRTDLREGSYIEAGEPIVEIVPLALGAVAQLQDSINALREKERNTSQALMFAKQLSASQKESGERITESLADAKRVAESKVEQARNKVSAAEAEYLEKRNKWQNAIPVTPRLVSSQDLYSMEQFALAAKQKLDEMKNALEQAQSDLSVKTLELAAKAAEVQVKNDKTDIDISKLEGDLSEIRQKLPELETKMQEYDRLTVEAPRSGYIQQWQGVVGSDIIKKGDALCVIVPETTDLAVEMRVSGNDMPLIHEGDRVRLQFEGWPAVQFVGWPSVAVGTFGGKVNRVFPTDDGKGNFRVLVTPDKHFDGESDWPDSRYLRQGVRANGWVLLKRVPLGYEIWRQLNGFPPVVSDEEPGKGKSKDDKGSKVKLPKA
jgi:multidrug resistance efflux pump